MITIPLRHLALSWFLTQEVNMKITQLLSAITVLALLASCAGIENIKKESGGDWQSLFAKNDLQQWEVVGDEIWTAENGVISVTPVDANTFIRSIKHYDNFHLKLEFWVNDNTNSGIFFRCMDGEEITAANCYEANIWDNHPNQSFRTGAIVMVAEPIAHVETLDKWNSYEIIANGKDITLKVNGTTTNQIQNNKLTSGSLALQYYGKGLIKFRNLTIKEL